MDFLDLFPTVFLAHDDVKIMHCQRNLGLLHVVWVLHSTPANPTSIATGGSVKVKTCSDDSSVVKWIFWIF